MGVRRCLARSLTSLALMRTPKSANGPRSNSFRPDSPFATNFPRGRKTQPAPLTTPDMVRSGRVLPTFHLTTGSHVSVSVSSGYFSGIPF